MIRIGRQPYRVESQGERPTGESSRGLIPVGEAAVEDWSCRGASRQLHSTKGRLYSVAVKSLARLDLRKSWTVSRVAIWTRKPRWRGLGDMV